MFWIDVEDNTREHILDPEDLPPGTYENQLGQHLFFWAQELVARRLSPS